MSSACRSGQRLFELLLDAEGIGGSACPEFQQRMPIARAPGRERECVAPPARGRRDATHSAAPRRLLEIQSGVPEIY
jgi:hypothetical protein